jgi:hypothetical protein
MGTPQGSGVPLPDELDEGDVGGGVDFLIRVPRAQALDVFHLIFFKFSGMSEKMGFGFWVFCF